MNEEDKACFHPGEKLLSTIEHNVLRDSDDVS
jgi:hypothetical protein